MKTSLSAAVALLAAALPAQQVNLTAHPQDTLTGGSANFSPFGVFSSGNGAEARTQILVPKDELPNAGALLNGIELVALASGPVDYASLQITASPTAATSLQSSFAANLTASSTVVLQATSLQVTFSSSAWVQIPFTQPYVHDGTSALVLDIQKVVQSAPTYTFVTHKKTSNPGRADRPQMRYTFGGPGSGQNTATSGFASAEPISFRLVWDNAPTLRNRSDSVPTGGQYTLGSPVTMTLEGDAGSFWALAAGLGFLTPSVTVPGLQGTFRLVGPVVFAGGLLDAAGEATPVIGIPNDPSLVGVYLTYQGGTIAPATGAIVLTNGTDHFIN